MRLRLEAADVGAALRERCSTDIAGMNTLIDSVLEVFRPDAPTAQTAATRIDLAALAQSAVDDLADAGADVAFEGPTVVITARPLPLRRVLDNLIGNALRYAGHARVRLEHDALATVLAVEDNGPGIPQAELERVLQPFRRVERSRNPATGGTGLGLYIANELARREGATLSLHNRPQGGLRAELRWRAG
ncbi:MAG TPA: ATP-binding protein [Burkholderiaceae bacterium]|nr:ATP-binding protein [Burkholderiaceae bacterium]